jgi:hypothetical protein
MPPARFWYAKKTSKHARNTPADIRGRGTPDDSATRKLHGRLEN